MPSSSRPRAVNLRRITSATLVCAASAGALLGSAGTASAVVRTEQTLDAAPSPVSWGSGLTFTGKLTRFGDRPVAGKQVDLEWRGGPDQPWSVAASGTTNAEGVAAVPATITVSGDWRLHYSGDRINDPAISPTVNVQSQQPMGRRIVDAAAAQAGKPYVWGATGPNSFDCSGLTQFVHRQFGIELPRTSANQRVALTNIAKGDMQPGDLVFFANGGRVYHVGIFADDNQMWAAPESGDVVRLQKIWTDAYTVGRAW
ncbi:C40 family peptidase [Amycolatopsis anabasis]|uniref:C40 family peptidase n=1 Tax=Amycolatopsis anabasis TaxID=1840409 RepID=UPI0031B5C887